MNRQDIYEVMKEAFAEIDLSGGVLDTLPDTYLWKRPLINQLTALHYDDLGLPRCAGFLFAGPEGCGKHTTAEALMCSIAVSEQRMEDTYVLRLRADDFRLKTNEEIYNAVDAVFDAAADTEGLRFVVFDQMDRYENLPVILNRIADIMPDAGDREPDAPFDRRLLYVICITEDASLVLRELKRKLIRMNVSLPDITARENVLKTQLQKTVRDWNYPDSLQYRTIRIEPQGYDTDELAAQTEGFSYRELTDLTDSLMMAVSGTSFGTEPETVLRPERALVEMLLSSVHEGGNAAAAPAPGILSASAMKKLLDAVSAGNRQENGPEGKQINVKELISKGEHRSFDENLSLIDMVSAENG